MKKHHQTHRMIKMTYCESRGRCSGGPKYANNVASLSKGLLPTALWSLNIQENILKYNGSIKN